MAPLNAPKSGVPLALQLRVGFITGLTFINFSQKMTSKLVLLCINIRAKSELYKKIV